MKRIASIQDISCLGRCSLTVALPVISAMAVECAIVPTAVLSTHTMFPGFISRDLSDQLLPIARHWKSQNVTLDAICTGYLASPRQTEEVCDFFDLLAGPDTLLFVDPAMATADGCTAASARTFRRICAGGKPGPCGGAQRDGGLPADGHPLPGDGGPVLVAGPAAAGGGPGASLSGAHRGALRAGPPGGHGPGPGKRRHLPVSHPPGPPTTSTAPATSSPLPAPGPWSGAKACRRLCAWRRISPWPVFRSPAGTPTPPGTGWSLRRPCTCCRDCWSGDFPPCPGGFPEILLKIPKNIVVRTGKILYNPYVERMRGGKTALVQKTKGEQPL